MITHKFRFTLSCFPFQDENHNEFGEEGVGRVVFVVGGGGGGRDGKDNDRDLNFDFFLFLFQDSGFSTKELL
jgi:hypothetical protein